jgi:hypothetical protein
LPAAEAAWNFAAEAAWNFAAEAAWNFAAEAAWNFAARAARTPPRCSRRSTFDAFIALAGGRR